MLPTESGPPPVFLILEDDPVVAEDLSELLREHSPDARIHLSRSRAETAGILAQLDRISAAILDGGVYARDLGDLSDRLTKQASRIIVLHDLDVEPTGDGDGRIYVRRPFTTEMILGALTEFKPKG